jgi:glycosyltransferase 2 family protein
MRIPFLVRAAVSISILVLILHRTSLEHLAARAAGAAPALLAAALVLAMLMALLVALRWRALAQWLGLAVPAALAVRAVFLGLFAGQLLPSTLGTDLLRGWAVARHTGRIECVAASLVADRLVGLFAACVLLALSYPWLSEALARFADIVVPAALAVSGAVLLAFVLACTGVVRSRWVGAVEGAVLRLTPILVAIAVALVIHGIAVLTAALTAAAYGAALSLGMWLAIIPVSVIACAVPVSINGWGVREGVIVALAAGYGMPAPDALLVSLTLGVLNALASLPGGYVLLRQPRA